MRKNRRLEEEVAVDNQKVAVADILCRCANGVGRTELLRLFDVRDSASESVAVRKMVAYPTLSVADDDAHFRDARVHDAFDGPLEQRPVADGKHGFGPVVVERVESFAFTGGQDEGFHLEAPRV